MLLLLFILIFWMMYMYDWLFPLQGCWWCYHTPTTKAQKATDRSILPTTFSTSKCKLLSFNCQLLCGSGIWLRINLKIWCSSFVYEEGIGLVTYFIDYVILVTTDKWPRKDIHLFLFKKIQKSHRANHPPLVVAIPHKHFSRVTDLYIV